jgi:hypothetical protein
MTDHPEDYAFPVAPGDVPYWQPGMTLRAYAAIQLRVPDSGIDWLDDMIRQAKCDEIAVQEYSGMQGILDAHQIADAMLAEREKGGGE